MRLASDDVTVVLMLVDVLLIVVLFALLLVFVALLDVLVDVGLTPAAESTSVYTGPSS